MAEIQSIEQVPHWKIIGPGLVLAAAGVGAGDLVTSLIAGSKFGYTLIWAVVFGAVVKITLVEGVGRYSLATGRTIFEGWRSLGIWTTLYFAPYIVVWGFVVGAAAMSATGLPLVSLLGGGDVKVFAIVNGLIGLALVWLGRYRLFERIMTVLIGIMFVTVVGAAVLVTPNLREILLGLRPIVPGGSIVNVVSVMGALGGSITLAAYGYWVREKGWTTPRFMRVMRLDGSVGYVVIAVFAAAMVILGAELLYSANIAGGGGDQTLVNLIDVLRDRYGVIYSKLFLIGFWAAAFSSLIGVWNGVSLMFADFVGNLRGLEHDDPRRRDGGRYFKWFLLWLTFPPMSLLWLDQPVGLIIAYGVLGAFFVPFLAMTLLWLLNTGRTPNECRNRLLSNVFLTLCGAVFVALAVYEVINVVRDNL